jgi:hypothetical protein
VHVGRNPTLFQGERLLRLGAGDERKGRTHPADHAELLFASIARYEAEDPYAPRPPAGRSSRLIEQRLDFRSPHQRQRQERKRSFFRHSGGKRRPVADASHRPLQDREASPVRLSERRVRR